MKSRKTRFWPVLMLAASLSIGAAASCSDASGPRFPPPEDPNDQNPNDTLPDQG